MASGSHDSRATVGDTMAGSRPALCATQTFTCVLYNDWFMLDKQSHWPAHSEKALLQANSETSLSKIKTGHNFNSETSYRRKLVRGKTVCVRGLLACNWCQRHHGQGLTYRQAIDHIQHD